MTIASFRRSMTAIRPGPLHRQPRSYQLQSRRRRRQSRHRRKGGGFRHHDIRRRDNSFTRMLYEPDAVKAALTATSPARHVACPNQRQTPRNEVIIPPRSPRVCRWCVVGGACVEPMGRSLRGTHGPHGPMDLSLRGTHGPVLAA